MYSFLAFVACLLYLYLLIYSVVPLRRAYFASDILYWRRPPSADWKTGLIGHTQLTCPGPLVPAYSHHVRH